MAQWTDPHVVLSISRGYDSEELKKAYRRALLQYHPDKAAPSPSPANKVPGYTIDDINKAYSMLRERGGDYGIVENDDVVVNFNEVCDLGMFEEHEQTDGSMEWIRDCRCGQRGYRLTELDLESNGDADEIAVQCSGCSLWILVQYAVE